MNPPGNTERTGVVNALTFDLEHWHMATLVSDSIVEPEDFIESSANIVLDVLDQHDVQATFFVVGKLAAEYPDLIRRISEAGHELASHGHTHTPVFELTENEFAHELSSASAAINRAAGVDPIGFRAPNFSITAETAWAFRVLCERDFQYDSSVFPMRTPMYGVSRAPVHPYSVHLERPFRAHSSAGSGLTEWPVAVVGDRLRAPIAGGFYARVLPSWALHRGIKWLNNRGIPSTLYFHPWEFNPDVSVKTPSFLRRFVTFYGIENAVNKLDRLLDTFVWAPLRTVIDRHTTIDQDTPSDSQQQPPVPPHIATQ